MEPGSGPLALVPFSAEVFLALFESYNLAIWPAQIFAWLLGAAALALSFSPFPSGGRIVFAILALFWAFTGYGYHFSFFAEINVVAPWFAALFALQALLLAARAVATRPEIAFRRDAAGWAGAAMALYALVLYPLSNLAAGHQWPLMPSFGVTPCPLVIFTFAMLLLARPAPPLTLLVIPLVWAVIGGSAVWFFGMVEDIALPLAAVIALVLAIRARMRTD